MSDNNETMNDQFPDRLSVDSAQPVLQRGDFVARCRHPLQGRGRKPMSRNTASAKGWVRVTAGNAKDRHGNPLTIKVHGPVEPYFRDKAQS